MELSCYYFSDDMCFHKGAQRAEPVQSMQHKDAVKNRGNGWEVLISRLLGSAGPATGCETGHHTVLLTMRIHQAEEYAWSFCHFWKQQFSSRTSRRKRKKKREILEEASPASTFLPARHGLMYVLDAGIHVHTQPEAPDVHICIATTSKKEIYFAVTVWRWK